MPEKRDDETQTAFAIRIIEVDAWNRAIDAAADLLKGKCEFILAYDVRQLKRAD